MYEPRTSCCPHCRKQLSWLERMKGVNFCSPDHRDAYLNTLDSAILARLGHTRTGLPDFVRSPLVASSQPVTALAVASAQASS